jgi:hypothetical protein
MARPGSTLTLVDADMVANPLLLCGALRFEKKQLLFSNVSAAVISTRVNEMVHVSQVNLAGTVRPTIEAAARSDYVGPNP